MRRIPFLYMLIVPLLTFAQVQQGIVKTRGRMVNGQHIPGVGLPGATVTVKGANAVVSCNTGTFSLVIPGNMYYLQNVQKNGYELVDADALTKSYKYSTNPLNLVMETPEQQRQDLLAAERKIRKNLQKQLQQKEDEIEALKVTQAVKDSLLRILYQQQSSNERLIADMAKRYAMLDYDQLDDFYRQVSWFIENGELTRADSMLRTRGDINSQVQDILQQAQAIQETESELGKAKAVHKADIDEAARRCYCYYETFFAQHQNDSAAYYLELRAKLDSTNLGWQNKAGLFIRDFLANYSKALSYYQSILRQSFEPEGSESGWTATAFNNIGCVYSFQHNYQKALEYYNKALNTNETLFGKNHPNIAFYYNNIGNVYDNQGDYTKALEFYNKSLSIWEKTSGLEHANVAMAYSNIGCVYYEQGNYEQALEYNRKALLIREKVFGIESHEVAQTINNLGLVYSRLLDFPKALEYLCRARDIWENVLNPEHPDLIKSYNNIGSVFYDLGDYSKALESFSKALALHEKVFGKEHPDVATSYNNIGSVYNGQGDYAKALEYYNKALGIREKAFSKEHPDIAISFDNIGNVYTNQGDYTHAMEFFRKALDIREKIFGKEHFNTLISKSNIYNINYQLALSSGSLSNFLSEHAFFVATIDGDTPAKQQGMSGEYFIFEYADWTQDSMTSLFDKIEEMRGKPKNILVMKDGVIRQIHFENTIGVLFMIKQVTKEERQYINEAYEDWKEIGSNKAPK